MQKMIEPQKKLVDRGFTLNKFPRHYIPLFEAYAIPCFSLEMTSSTATNLWSWSLNFSSILMNPAE